MESCGWINTESKATGGDLGNNTGEEQTSLLPPFVLNSTTHTSSSNNNPLAHSSGNIQQPYLGGAPHFMHHVNIPPQLQQVAMQQQQQVPQL
jgi:hypothetical protein